MEKENFLTERKLLGKRIMQLRYKCINEKTNKPISQEELGLRIGLVKNHIGKIERGQTNTTVDVLFAIAREFKVNISELFNFDEI
ncbi:helix-turn-helix domain-containing protein [Flavobacterium sp. TP390]|uniref:Helix-turn-helix domain-containing protein n=1 Tax=Flavobacterium profundi TaxID=1774945 RepID=A0A6I4IED1_9FLAO|nr:helix-turn-helix transcriptional regulator [Flavobacterium profundi]MVO08033.1 helix-turn-helix domain-containing protein [Flavobacterium profundi]